MTYMDRHRTQMGLTIYMHRYADRAAYDMLKKVAEEEIMMAEKLSYKSSYS